MVLHGSHQYTPFMLAYIPAPWILWVSDFNLHPTSEFIYRLTLVMVGGIQVHEVLCRFHHGVPFGLSSPEPATLGKSTTCKPFTLYTYIYICVCVCVNQVLRNYPPSSNTLVLSQPLKMKPDKAFFLTILDYLDCRQGAPVFCHVLP